MIIKHYNKLPKKLADALSIPSITKHILWDI